MRRSHCTPRHAHRDHRTLFGYRSSTGLPLNAMAILLFLLSGCGSPTEQPAEPEEPAVSVSEFVSRDYDRENMAEPLQHAFAIYTAEDGEVYVHQEMPIYIRMATSDADTAKTYLLAGENVNPFTLDGPGRHHLKHEHRAQAINVFHITSDDNAPKSVVEFRGAQRFSNESTVFYGPNLEVSVRSTDDVSGVQNSYVSLDGAEFFPNTSDLAFDKEKIYSLRNYSVDNVGNVEEPAEYEFVVDLTPPTVVHTFENAAVDHIISPQTNLILTSNDDLSGVRTAFYRFDSGTFQAYDGTKVPLTSLGEGEHTLTYYSVDQVGNESQPTTLTIYFDETPPVASRSINGDRFPLDDRTYVSERTEIELTATDNKVDVASIEYEIDGKGFVKYTSPFKLPPETGRHEIKYRSTDEVKNVSPAENFVLFMDRTSPTSQYVFDGPTFTMRDTLYITTITKVILPAQDEATGVKDVMFILDANESTPFTTPFTVQGRGFHEVLYKAIDNVNNNESQQRVAFVVDDRPPEIFHHFSATPYEEIDHEGERLGVFPQLVQVYLAATDDISGSRAIYYSINDGPENVFVDPLKNLGQGIIKLQIRAIDNVTNESKTTIKFAIGRF